MSIILQANVLSEILGCNGEDGAYSCTMVFGVTQKMPSHLSEQALRALVQFQLE